MADSAHNLEAMIKECLPTSKVDLIEKHLTDNDMDVVVNCAITDKRCKQLLLSTNQITAAGSSTIAKALNNNTTLTFLSLSYNRLSDDGVRSLARTLALNNSQLQILSLHKTGITDQGVRDLARMLKKNTTLTWLHLGGNEISDKSIPLLTDALIRDEATLKVLDLSKNPLITDSSVDLLVQMLEQNTSLETLWIYKCNISLNGQKRLEKAAQSDRRFFLLFTKAPIFVWKK